MNQDKAIAFFSLDELIELAKKIEPKSAVDAGKLDFIISKIKSRRLGKNQEETLADLSSTIWHDITGLHPLSDGNKRLAAEAAIAFLKMNGFAINSIINGFVFISLKLANNELEQKELKKWIKERMVKS